MVSAIPDGYHSITAYLVVRDAAKAIEFYKTVFGATELFRLPGPDGTIGHAELRIGNSHLMLADENQEAGAFAPAEGATSPVGLLLYIEHVDLVFAKALQNGAELDREVADQFYGDRSGNIVDPFGHRWTIATHVEDVTPEEMQARVAKLYGV